MPTLFFKYLDELGYAARISGVGHRNRRRRRTWGQHRTDGVVEGIAPLRNGLILGITLVCMLPFLAAEAVFLWLLLRSQRSPKYQINQTRTVATSELGAAQPRVLQAPSPSITEHTTHTLEPARSDRNTQ